MLLTFEKSGYMRGRYIPTVRDVDLENVIIKKPGEYAKRLQNVFASDRFGSFW